MTCDYGQLAMAKDPEATFYKRLEGFHPCEVSKLEAGPTYLLFNVENSSFSFLINFIVFQF